MSGYTPVFGSMFNGSLCGRWPALAVWATILPMADRFGQIDMTPEAICALSGWPLELLREGLRQLCEPDPRSRSKSDDGRRLALIDPDGRDWGWQVVNHAAYREKARKAMQQIEATESGRDAERKRIEREKHRQSMSSAVQRRPAPSGHVPVSPAVSSADRLSDSDADSDRKQEKTPPTEGSPMPDGLDSEAFNRWLTWRSRVKRVPVKDRKLAAVRLASFGPDQAAVVQQSIDNEWQGLFPLKHGQAVRKPAAPLRDHVTEATARGEDIWATPKEARR